MKTDVTQWIVQDKFPIKPGSYAYRECEHCGDRIYEFVFKLFDLYTEDTIFVDEKCIKPLT